MAVRLRMKKLGRRHRPFFRICAMDARSPRDGRVIEELGHYDPMVRETDARVVLDRERVDYWLGVGAKPTPKVAVLIRKYGSGGTHLEQNEAALEKLQAERKHRGPPEGFKPPVLKEPPQEEEAPKEEATAEEGSEEKAAETAGEQKSEEAKAAAEPAAAEEAAESAAEESAENKAAEKAEEKTEEKSEA